MLADRLRQAAGGAIVIPIVAAYLDQETYATNLSEYPFTLDLGAADDAKKIGLGIAAQLSGADTQTVTGVTIDGVTATKHMHWLQNNVRVEIWSADVATGGVKNVVVTWSAKVGNCGAGAIELFGANDTPYDTGGDGNPSGGAMTDTINDLPPGSAVFAVSVSRAQNADFVWTNIDVVWNVDTFGGEGTSYSGALSEFEDGPVELIITSTPSSAVDNVAMCFVAWEP